MWHPRLNIAKKHFWLFGDELDEIEDKELGLLSYCFNQHKYVTFRELHTYEVFFLQRSKTLRLHLINADLYLQLGAKEERSL